LEPHPCLDEEWSTTFRKTYLKPLGRSKPNAHQKRAGWDIEFDEKMTESKRNATKASGFQNNSQLFDETTWKTERNLHTDINRTEYRNRYNVLKPFHKPNLLNSHGRMKPKERFRVYDNTDCNPNTNWDRQAHLQTKFRSNKARSNHTSVPRGRTIENPMEAM
jgi:hypothetical protein